MSDTPRPQLQMVWPRERADDPPAYTLAEGYFLRTYQEGDEAAYVRLMQRAGFTNWGEAQARPSIERSFPEGLFFVVHAASGALVATAAAQRNGPERYPLMGELGWVGADPDHRGRRLGYAVCAAATARLLAEKLSGIMLLTDDFRLPAIVTYLRLGWLPHLYAPGMVERWQAVADGIGLSYAQLGAIEQVMPWR